MIGNHKGRPACFAVLLFIVLLEALRFLKSRESS
jgi:hypothetical protein